ncbi:diacylglycerol lipase-alpha [Lepeophtheirus salmonis]|nr:diacylglycerol lipase-alpha-like [Lepeophtheirus salmonis]XP_040564211.1 diacylglycerol lipase-alpha-like [Lepeophtheirus salmonis]XP_040564212.1 diacylglycerol lipase-alpha-like [Lepeophtheirus salmonis]
MPGIIVFRRRWAVGSDDLIIPAGFLIIFHSVWLVVLSITLFQFHGPKDPITNQNINPISDNIPIDGILSSFILDWSCDLLIEICLSVISLRGSVLNDKPRWSSEILLYLKIILWIFEIILTILSGRWLITQRKMDDGHSSKLHDSVFAIHKVVLGLVVSNSVIFLTAIMTIWCSWDTAGRKWLKLKRYQQSLRAQSEDSKIPFRRSDGSKTTRNWRQRKVRRAYESSWDHRCHLLFCCMSSSKSPNSRTSFADIAKLLSEFFQDLDVVPSDVIVGLILLRKRQQLRRLKTLHQKEYVYLFLSGVKVTPDTRFLDKKKPSDLSLLADITHFMHYAVGVYGWPMYVRKKTGLAVCRLCSSIRTEGDTGLKRSDSIIVDDNCCGCNFAAYAQMCGDRLTETTQIVYMTYHVDVGESPFLIALDFYKKVIVISIRGTLSLKDVLTDLNAEAEPISNASYPEEDWVGHKGMVISASYIHQQLIQDKLLSKAFNWTSETSSYPLICVGHSLGAGIAAILSILLKQDYPNTHCFAYSPPGGLLSRNVVNYTKSFITSVVVGKDVIPRVGLHQLEALRHDLMYAIHKNEEPKYKILSSALSCCGGGNENWTEADLSATLSPRASRKAPSNNIENEDSQITKHPLDSSIHLSVHEPLFPPGQIIHLVRYHPRKIRAKKESKETPVMPEQSPVRTKPCGQITKPLMKF